MVVIRNSAAALLGRRVIVYFVCLRLLLFKTQYFKIPIDHSSYVHVLQLRYCDTMQNANETRRKQSVYIMGVAWKQD